MNNEIKHWVIMFFLLLALPASTIAADESVASLRGKHPIEAMSEKPLSAKVILPRDGIHPRDIPHQPPLIPHKTDKVRISLRQNQCLKCHGYLEYKEVGATKIGDNHYINRAGKVLNHISTRYYFCTQCHAPQEDLPPIVENKFKSIIKAEDRIHVKDSRKKLIKELNKEMNKYDTTK